MPLGRLWDAFGWFLAPLGQPLASSWDLLGRSWAPLGWSGPPLGRILVPRTLPGLHFKGFWRVPGLRFPTVFAAPCALLPNAFFDAVTIIFAFTVTIFLFFRCGGLCAAHGI